MSDSATPPFVSLDHPSDSSTGGSLSDSTLDPYFAAVEWIAGLKVLRHLGHGGSSDVYLCEQTSPNRQVALKLLKISQCDPRRQRRFQLEIDLLATLEHPGIARIFDAGIADVGRGPQPYYTMQYIDGERLDLFLHSKSIDELTITDRIELFLKIADAVQCAHEHGIVHRDLKPGNILVTEDGQVKVIDFGLARLTDAEATMPAVTQTGHLVGTPLYMSPEQYKQNHRLPDARSDIYSLGLVLYEMLCGRLPYELSNRALVEIANTVLGQQPVPLGKVDRRLKGDLEVVVAKALEKDPADRYQSADEMCEDLKRFLIGEAILAKPPSTLASLARWYRRNPKLAASVTAATALLLTTSIVATISTITSHIRQSELEHQTELAEETSNQLQDANRELIASSQRLRLSTTNATLMRTALSRETNPSLTRSLLFDTDLIPEDQRGFAWKVLERQSDWEQIQGRWERGPVLEAAYSGDGSRVAIAALNAVDIRRSDDLSIVWSLNDLIEPPTLLALDQTGNRVAYRKTDRGLFLIDHMTNEKHELVGGPPDSASSVTFSPSGRIAVGTSEGRIRIWDSLENDPQEFQVGSTPVVGLRFNPDETQLSTAAADGTVQTVDVIDGAIADTDTFETMGMQVAQFSRDGRYLFGGRRFRHVRLWDRQTGQRIFEDTNPGPFVTCAVLDLPESRFGLATRSRIELIRPDDKPVFLHLGHTPVRALCASPDGASMLAGDHDGNVIVFRTLRPEVPRRIPLSSPKSGTIRFVQQGRTIAVCSGPGAIHVHNTANGEIETTLPPTSGLITDAEVSRDGSILYYSLTSREILSWDFELGAPGEFQHSLDERVVDLVISPDESRMFGISKLGNLWSFGIDSGTVQKRSAEHEDSCSAIVYSPSQSALFTADDEGLIRRWDIDPLAPVRSIEPFGSRVPEMAISPDGKQLAAACGDGYVRVYDSESLDLIRELIVHTSAVRSLDFSPDGKTLATGGLDNRVILWDTEVWQPQIAWDVEGDGVRSVRFSPDGNRLAVAGNYDQILVWEAEDEETDRSD